MKRTSAEQPCNKMSRRQMLKIAGLAGTGFFVASRAECNEERQMEIGETTNSTYKISWDKGELEVNLIPANRHLLINHSPATVCCKPRFDGGLIYAHDNVGITSLKLTGFPQEPRICWDNREHHFWKGFNGAFRPRNAIVNEIQMKQEKSAIALSFYYIVDFIRTTVSWTFHNRSSRDFICWDTTFTFENLNKFALEEYMALFACYHEPGTNYFWDANDRISECAEHFVAYPDEDKARAETMNMLAFADMLSRDSKTQGKNSPNTIPQAQKALLYGNPVLLSGKKDWYGNGQHIVMVEPGKCISINSARNQARDWMLSPGQKLFQPQASFSARVRHIIGDVGGIEDLKLRWADFMEHLNAK